MEGKGEGPLPSQRVSSLAGIDHKMRPQAAARKALVNGGDSLPSASPGVFGIGPDVLGRREIDE
jgi:hypothetical protein